MPVTINELRAVISTFEKIIVHCQNRIKWAQKKIDALMKEKTAPKAKR
jgi:exonuclease VII small subunit